MRGITTLSHPLWFAGLWNYSIRPDVRYSCPYRGRYLGRNKEENTPQVAINQKDYYDPKGG